MNHSQKRANAEIVKVAVDKIPHVCLVASRDIDVSEEILFDYGDRRPEVTENNPWLKE